MAVAQIAAPPVGGLDLGKRTVIAIPGMLTPPEMLLPLEWRLRHEYNVVIPYLGSLWGDIEVLGARLLEFFRALDKALAAHRVHLGDLYDEVGFLPVSMGGLILASAERQDAESTRRIFRKENPHPTLMLGVPVRGTPRADWWLLHRAGKHFAQMSPRSGFIRKHRQHLVRRRRVVYVFSPDDWIVPPQYAHPIIRTGDVARFILEAPVKRHVALVSELRQRFLLEALDLAFSTPSRMRHVQTQRRHIA